MVGKPHEGRKKPLSRKMIMRRYRAKLKHGRAIAHRADVIAERREATARAEAKLANSTKLYELIVIDPPWDDSEDAYAESGKGRSAAMRYPTMTLAQMKERYPRLPAAPHALIYMWTTSQYLRQAMDLLEHWGATYGGIIGWDKVLIGKGRRHRIVEEFIIYGSIGNGLPIPLAADKTLNHFREAAVRERGVHSRKPDKLYDDLARQYPDVAKLEMFARRPREGWDTHGNEVE
jgi:N6-adenosine-specific RNA methylase IME4